MAEHDYGIWLKHPVHGIKRATLPAEAEADRKNGWVDCAPYGREETIPETAPVAKSEERGVESPHVTPQAPSKRGPGRPRKTVDRADEGII